jgi:drug/metabolite transporter (DMT)-like permease
MGQAIALAAAGSNAASYRLANAFGLQVQLLQLVPVYLLLSLHLLFREPPPPTEAGTPTTLLPGTRIRLRVPWRVYGALSVLDVVPNLLQLASLRRTSLTSTTLLASLTVPSTMLFSRLLMARRFSRARVAGAVLCVLGAIVAGSSDAAASAASAAAVGASSPGTNSTGLALPEAVRGDPSRSAAGWWPGAGPSRHPDGQRRGLGALREGALAAPAAAGDALAAAAAVLYGLGDAAGEYSVKYIDRREYLGMIGLLGAALSGAAVPLLERAGFERLLSDPGLAPRRGEALALLALYALCVAFYYVSASHFYRSSDATLLNLCLLASNPWALGLSRLAGGGGGAPAGPRSAALYGAALLLMAAGVALYQKRSGDEDGDEEEEEEEEEEGGSGSVPPERGAGGGVGGPALLLVEPLREASRRRSGYEPI